MMMIKVSVMLNTFYSIQMAISYLSCTLTMIDVHIQTTFTKLTTYFVKAVK